MKFIQFKISQSNGNLFANSVQQIHVVSDTTDLDMLAYCAISSI